VGVIHSVFGDGAVRSIAYEIDRVLFNHLGDRRDGNILTEKIGVN
jgi:hypothetical protein